VRTSLTTELSITGTAEDLDNQLPSTLAEYVEAVQEIHHSLQKTQQKHRFGSEYLANGEFEETLRQFGHKVPDRPTP
jgi:hypothetical protein